MDNVEFVERLMTSYTEWHAITDDTKDTYSGSERRVMLKRAEAYNSLFCLRRQIEHDICLAENSFKSRWRHLEAVAKSTSHPASVAIFDDSRKERLRDCEKRLRKTKRSLESLEKQVQGRHVFLDFEQQNKELECLEFSRQALLDEIDRLADDFLSLTRLEAAS